MWLSARKFMAEFDWNLRNFWILEKVWRIFYYCDGSFANLELKVGFQFGYSRNQKFRELDQNLIPLLHF